MHVMLFVSTEALDLRIRIQAMVQHALHDLSVCRRLSAGTTFHGYAQRLDGCVTTLGNLKGMDQRLVSCFQSMQSVFLTSPYDFSGVDRQMHQYFMLHTHTCGATFMSCTQNIGVSEARISERFYMGTCMLSSTPEPATVQPITKMCISK